MFVVSSERLEHNGIWGVGFRRGKSDLSCFVYKRDNGMNLTRKSIFTFIAKDKVSKCTTLW